MIRRGLMVVAGVALSCSPCLAQSMTAADCAKIAPSTSQAVTAIDALRRNAEALPIQVIVQAGNKGVSDAARRVDTARQKLVPAMKEFVEAMQDLNYQLNLCSR